MTLTKLRRSALVLAGMIALTAPLGLASQPAHAAPYINCDQPKYNGKASASIRCNAASKGQIRIKATCFVPPAFPAGNKYTAWRTIPAGGAATMTFQAGSWCQGLQIWRVDPEIR